MSEEKKINVDNLDGVSGGYHEHKVGNMPDAPAWNESIQQADSGKCPSCGDHHPKSLGFYRLDYVDQKVHEVFECPKCGKKWASHSAITKK